MTDKLGAAGTSPPCVVLAGGDAASEPRRFPDPAGHATAERQAEAIRAHWARQRRAVTVTVDYVAGAPGYTGGWSAHILTPMGSPK